MKTTSFFGDIFKIYSQIPVRKENQLFYKLDKMFYYLADSEKSKVCFRNIYEIDISAAFPTICKFLFKEEKTFLEKINSLMNNKLERNIFIATTLKDTEYLKQLNTISKMIISSILMDADPNAIVLELKKDGIVYSGEPVTSGKLYQYFSQMGFSIKSQKIQFYLRCQKTSHFFNPPDQLQIKGFLKDRPEFLYHTLINILNNNDVDYASLNSIYSKKFFKIIQLNNLDELFLKYFVCNNSKYLTYNFHYERIKSLHNILNLTAKNYLKVFIYPFYLEMLNANTN